MRAVQHPETPASATSPRLTVGVTHGRGSESIAGPQQDQHHPLQQTTARPSGSSTSLNASPASPVNSDGSRGARSSRTELNSQQLTPSQLAFVKRVEHKMRLEAGAESRPLSGSGDAGAPRLISEESTELVSPQGSAGASRQQHAVENWQRNERQMRLEARATSHNPSGPGGAGARRQTSEEGPKFVSPRGNAEVSQRLPSIEEQQRDELEKLRAVVAEQDAAMAAMHDLLDAMQAEPPAPAELKENRELNVSAYQPRSGGVSLETGTPRASTPAPTSEQSQIQPLPVDRPRFCLDAPCARFTGPRGPSPQDRFVSPPGPLSENEPPQHRAQLQHRSIKPLTGYASGGGRWD